MTPAAVEAAPYCFPGIRHQPARFPMARRRPSFASAIHRRELCRWLPRFPQRHHETQPIRPAGKSRSLACRRPAGSSPSRPSRSPVRPSSTPVASSPTPAGGSWRPRTGAEGRLASRPLAGSTAPARASATRCGSARRPGGSEGPRASGSGSGRPPLRRRGCSRRRRTARDHPGCAGPREGRRRRPTRG